MLLCYTDFVKRLSRCFHLNVYQVELCISVDFDSQDKTLLTEKVKC